MNALQKRRIRAVIGKPNHFDPLPDPRCTPRRVLLTPFSELDQMDRMGWGDTPQINIPKDWRTRRGPGK